MGVATWPESICRPTAPSPIAGPDCTGELSGVGLLVLGSPHPAIATAPIAENMAALARFDLKSLERFGWFNSSDELSTPIFISFSFCQPPRLGSQAIHTDTSFTSDGLKLVGKKMRRSPIVNAAGGREPPAARRLSYSEGDSYESLPEAELRIRGIAKSRS
jgi:hypothetical protein